MHVALYFPGGYGAGQDPFENYFSWLTIRSLEQADAYVIPVHYDDDVLAPDRERFNSGVRRAIRGALAHHEPDRMTLVGKSRGTNALALACSEELGLPDDSRLIWLTPVWRGDWAWKAACANTIPSLHLVGLGDDQYHLPERHAAVAGETVAIASAGHGLTVAGDIFASLDALRAMAEAIVRFASRS